MKGDVMKIRRFFAAAVSILLVFTLTFTAVSAAPGLEWLDIVDNLFNGNTATGETDYLRVFFQAINALTTGDAPEYSDRSKGSKEISAVTLSEYQTYADNFNASVNEIKKKNPGFEITAWQGLPLEAGASAQITDKFGMISQLISVGTGILFGQNNTIYPENLLPAMGIDTLFNDKREERVLVGQDCRDIVSVKGTDFVSNLTAEDFYEIDYTASRYGGYIMKGYLWDGVNPDSASAQGRVYDLMDDAKFYQTIASFAPGVSFDIIRIKYVDCYVEAKVNKNDQLTYYSTHYKCVLDIDEEKAQLSGVDMSSMLGMGDTVLYESEVIYQNFNWSARPLGDVNGDGKLRADDARLALRAAAKLSPIEKTDVAFAYADVNGDGFIRADDARKILRVSADLDKF